jgi:type I restriction enzyme R subunit
MRNEAQTRFELIDPMLIDHCGWSRHDIRIEQTLPQIDIIQGKGYRRPAGRTDYVLCRPLAEESESIPLAIIEAKKESLPAEHGLQQARRYKTGELHHVPFFFSSNGHQFVEYDEKTGITSAARALTEFPRPEELVERFLAARELNASSPNLKLLTTRYEKRREFLRYYQDAAIRAAFEQLIKQSDANQPPRVLLPLATGAGKTRLAAALLRKLFDAGRLGKALFLCDRTELRDNGLTDFQAVFGTDAAEVDTKTPQKNARVLIATYQTLDFSNGGKDAKFFLAHYPPGFFDVIVIDECHRSAWGEWNAILKNNSDAIQIGLTATPRQIRVRQVEDEETAKAVEEDRRRLADNYRYFGNPPYEYSYWQGVEDGYLAPAEIEQYDIYHDEQSDSERVRGVYRSDVADKDLRNALTGKEVTADAVAEKSEGGSLEARLIMPERVEAMCAHLFSRLLATGDGDPLQKTIIFCASDHHADLVTNQMNNLYARWAREHGQKRVQTYSFKCMSSVNGQSLIPDFRGRQRSHIIATTKDLLTTGVNVPSVRNIVFFRYLHSPILFHQMVGRGTRIDEASGKLMFRIFDYTGATALFGGDFITPPPSPGGEDPPPGPAGPPPVKVRGVQIEIEKVGNFNLLGIDGKMQRVTPQQYQQRLISELTQLVPSLAEFRDKWLEPAQRHELLDQLARQGLLPEKLREAAQLNGVSADELDLFDVLAALAYGIQPRTRHARAEQFDGGPDWLIQLPQPSTKVIRAIVRQFENAGTDALEARELWETPEIKQLRGLAALREAGNPAELMRKTKETLFVA